MGPASNAAQGNVTAEMMRRFIPGRDRNPAHMKWICACGVDASEARGATTKPGLFDDLSVLFRYLIFAAKGVSKEVYRCGELFFQLIAATENFFPRSIP